MNFTIEDARELGKKLGVNWNTSPFDVHQFKIGLYIELEHGTQNPKTEITNDDPLMTGKIALVHLNEFPDYYSRLAKMEREAAAYWDSHKKDKDKKIVESLLRILGCRETVLQIFLSSLEH